MQYLTDRAIASGIKRKSMQIIDDCLEVKCACCGEFWPHTLEFYHKDRSRLKSKCKACWEDTKHISQIPKTRIIGRPKQLRQGRQQ